MSWRLWSTSQEIQQEQYMELFDGKDIRMDAAPGAVLTIDCV